MDNSKERQLRALKMAYHILTDKRVANRYGSGFQLVGKDGTTYSYWDMLEDLESLAKAMCVEEDGDSNVLP